MIINLYDIERKRDYVRMDYFSYCCSNSRTNNADWFITNLILDNFFTLINQIKKIKIFKSGQEKSPIVFSLKVVHIKGKDQFEKIPTNYDIERRRDCFERDYFSYVSCYCSSDSTTIRQCFINTHLGQFFVPINLIKKIKGRDQFEKNSNKFI